MPKKSTPKSKPASREKKVIAPKWRNRIVGHGTEDPAKLVANPKNWRLHPKAQQDALQGVLAEVGWVQDVIVNRRSGLVVDGHARINLAIAAKERVPVVYVDLSDKEEALILASLDPLSAMAETNREALADLVGSLDVTDAAVNAMLQELVGADAGTAGLTDADECPPVPVAPVSRLGDLWILGEHRVLCGDSTDAASVARLMAGERAGLMNIDPPYGVSYANDERPNPGVAKPRVAKPRVAKDDLRDEVLQRFLESAFESAKVALLPNAAWYLWHAHLTQGYFAAAAAAAHVILHRQIIWVKPVLLLGRGQYHWKHEPCFMGWVEGQQPPDYAERNQTTVWEVGSVTQAERKEFNHATPKPVGLFTIPILKHLNAGEVCYDSFAGSGPQFIAAEMHARRCFGLEIDPQYVDVIVLRWQAFTGKQATLDGDGSTFADIAAGKRAVAA